jgi:nucleoside 2-deoxyribosyltransferase
LAVIDDFDAGVIWEMGYAHARGKSILGYSDIEGRGLNVMLAGCCNLGFVNGRSALTDIMKQHNLLPDGSYFPKNTWSGHIQ